MNKACLVITPAVALILRTPSVERLVDAAEVTSAAKFSLSSSAPHQLLRYHQSEDQAIGGMPE
jgi:hypothetical protein